MSSAVKDNKTVNAESECNNEVKNLLNVKSQNAESCPHRKTPVSQDIGTLHYDGRWNWWNSLFKNEVRFLEGYLNITFLKNITDLQKISTDMKFYVE